MGPICYDKIGIKSPASSEKESQHYDNTTLANTSFSFVDAKVQGPKSEKACDGRNSRFHLHPRRPNPLRKSTLIGAILFLLAVHLLNRQSNRLTQSRPDESIEERARDILRKNPLIDGHVDMPMMVRYKSHGQIDNKVWKDSFKNGPYSSHVDIKRLRQGLSGGAFWSLYDPCPKNATDFSDDNYVQGVQMTYAQIDIMDRISDMFPQDFSKARGIKAKDALHIFQSGTLISPLGIEGLHQIGNKASNLRRYHSMGVRYATLTHNCHNKYADAALEEGPFRKATPIFGGISQDGRKLINEMNRIGMIVDLSHVSAQTMEHVLGGSDGWEGSRAPVMFSHSSAYAICPHPRNVPDDILRLVKARNSVVMINIAGMFISCRDVGAENGLPEFVAEDNNISQVVKHIIYIGNLIGFDHVGIGTDFDGIEDTPAGLEDVSKYPALVVELLKEGVRNEDVVKILGGNVIRVWSDVEAVAAQLQASGEPALEDNVGYDW